VNYFISKKNDPSNDRPYTTTMLNSFVSRQSSKHRAEVFEYLAVYNVREEHECEARFEGMTKNMSIPKFGATDTER
jgi:hypothetical protein